MIIVQIVGGLGNQLFQYAHARTLALSLKQELYFDLGFFEEYDRSKDKLNTHIVYKLNNFNIKVCPAKDEEINKIRRRLLKPDIVRKVYRRLGGSSYVNKDCHFDNEKIDNCDIDTIRDYDDVFISGFFADQKYFIEIENIIREEFSLRESLNAKNQEMLSQIKTANSVSLHIRRGDYVGNNYFAEIPIEYYLKAVDYIEKHFPNSSYFVFSDDINWARANIKLDKKVVFVDINDASTDYMELILMSACKHNIIANSTFSWWGAWLNENKQKIIIAPKIWYNKQEAQKKYDQGHLVPSNWIKI